MPTLIHVDGFEHQTVSVNGLGIFSAVNRPAGVLIDTTVKRTGAASLNIVENGVTATYATSAPAFATQVLVGQLRFRIAAAPTVTSIMCSGVVAINPCKFLIVGSTGVIQAYTGSGPAVDGPAVCDSEWHRLDFRFYTDSATFMVDWYVDGVLQTQATSSGQTPSNMSALRYGSASAAHTLTVWFDDVVLSATAGDFPLDPCKVLSVVPTSDGTHVGNANCIEDQTGTDIVTPGYTTAYQLVDEWPANTDYIAQVAISGTSYAEVLFEDTTEATIWGVQGYLAYKSASTAANNGTARIVDADGNTLTNIYSGDMSESSLYYKSAIIAAPGGTWTPAGFNGLKARVGFSTDVTPNPYWNALLLQYAVPEAIGVYVNRSRLVSQAVQRSAVI